MKDSFLLFDKIKEIDLEDPKVDGTQRIIL